MPYFFNPETRTPRNSCRASSSAPSGASRCWPRWSTWRPAPSCPPQPPTRTVRHAAARGDANDHRRRDAHRAGRRPLHRARRRRARRTRGRNRRPGHRGVQPGARGVQVPGLRQAAGDRSQESGDRSQTPRRGAPKESNGLYLTLAPESGNIVPALRTTARVASSIGRASDS